MVQCAYVAEELAVALPLCADCAVAERCPVLEGDHVGRSLNRDHLEVAVGQCAASSAVEYDVHRLNHVADVGKRQRREPLLNIEYRSVLQTTSKHRQHLTRSTTATELSLTKGMFSTLTIGQVLTEGSGGGGAGAVG